ncbi:transposase [Thiorhodospira sibirica]|uniref:transposase n=1 Tax=Thiorhodospira sibirica TaxID=154347 RepID=UPI001FEB787E|nr:transposase [Thiorhodospira sibirica]
MIDPDSPKAGNGRRPIGLERMRRIHVMPQWFAYADPAMEEALHDIPLRREFAGRDAPVEAIPEESKKQFLIFSSLFIRILYCR